MSFLAGLPGQVKTLLDRLTAGRATNLDNLDAAVSSRAPSSTAVSNANYTSARATKLDQLDAAVSSRAAASTAVSNANYTSARATKLDNLDNLDAPISGIEGIPAPGATGGYARDTNGSTSFANAVSITGAGALLSVHLWGTEGSSESDVVHGEILIDGISVCGEFSSGAIASAANSGPGHWFDISGPIPFSSSLTVRHRASSTSYTSNIRVAYLKSS